MIIDRSIPTSGGRYRGEAEPLVRVCWLQLCWTEDGVFVRGRGRGADLVPLRIGRSVIERLVASTGCDAWLEVGGRVG